MGHQEVVKAHMRRAAQEVMLEEPHGGYRVVGYQLAPAMGAMRCVASGDAASWRTMADRSLTARAALEVPRGQARIAVLADLIERMCFRVAVGGAVGSGGAWRRPRRAVVGEAPGLLLRLAAVWRQRRPPARIRAVFGAPQTRPEEIAHVQALHLQAVFFVTVEDEAARRLARGRVPQLPPAECILQYADFQAMVMRSNTTSPGPDGISYTAWRQTPVAASPVGGVPRSLLGVLPLDVTGWASAGVQLGIPRIVAKARGPCDSGGGHGTVVVGQV